jgi:competence protein ComEC
MPAVLEAFRPGEVWLGRASPTSHLLHRIGRAARTLKIPVFHPARGALRCLGSACLEVLHPPADFHPGGGVSNDDSLVVRLTFRQGTLLLTGDLEREGERFLLASRAPLQSDLLKVAHHGSSTSSSGAFLDAVGPSTAVISAGEGNPFRHPSEQTLRRLGERDVRVLRTDRDGAVRLSWDGRRWVRRNFRE